MILSDVSPPSLRRWIDENVQDNLLREILDEWTWEKDPPNVVVENQEILGFCASRETDGFYKCCYLFLVPEARGKGYGKKLLELSFDEAKKRGLPYLYVSEERFDGWKIFQKKGFPFYTKDLPWGAKDYYFEVDAKNRKHLFKEDE